jgi:hypothetical protein
MFCILFSFSCDRNSSNMVLLESSIIYYLAPGRITRQNQQCICLHSLTAEIPELLLPFEVPIFCALLPNLANSEHILRSENLFKTVHELHARIRKVLQSLIG